MTRFAIIDLANLFSRARFVAQGDAFTKAGMALHIVFKSLRKLNRELGADHMVFATEGGSWRDGVYPAYKSARRAKKLAMTPNERDEAEVLYTAQKDLIEYLTEKTRCTVLHAKGIEGDDFVARWIQLHPDDEHIIVSGDSDFVQLLGPKVSIYDGIEDRTISISGIKDSNGHPLEFSVDMSKGKIKVKKSDPKNPVDPDFSPEPEWWRKALFVKIVRGDVGDGVFAAYPGITTKSSKKRTGIQAAWEDREAKGFAWNNFMQESWDKVTGFDDAGEAIRVAVKVHEEFAMNELLIDLTRQPEHVKDTMDEAIALAITKTMPPAAGIAFLKFAKQQDLPVLAEEAAYHVVYLNRAYPLERFKEGMAANG